MCEDLNKLNVVLLYDLSEQRENDYIYMSHKEFVVRVITGLKW